MFHTHTNPVIEKINFYICLHFLHMPINYKKKVQNDFNTNRMMSQKLDPHPDLRNFQEKFPSLNAHEVSPLCKNKILIIKKMTALYGNEKQNASE